jgi:pyridoxal phosphate enzyme (YggS family)
MNELCNKLKFYSDFLPEGGILVAVSKTKPVELIQQAYGCGHRDFGENKVQELRDKRPLLPEDIRWHMIGHLQRNKVKYIAPYIWLIHSVDNEKLLREIDKQAAKHKRIIPFLFQIKIAREETKFGLNEQEYYRLLNLYQSGEFPHTELKGLMGMATNTDDKQQVEAEFSYLKTLFDELKSKEPSVAYLSMGMTHDFKIAVKNGANVIRIGSGIFGKRV